MKNQTFLPFSLGFAMLLGVLACGETSNGKEDEPQRETAEGSGRPTTETPKPMKTPPTESGRLESRIPSTLREPSEAFLKESFQVHYSIEKTETTHRCLSFFYQGLNKPAFGVRAVHDWMKQPSEPNTFCAGLKPNTSASNLFLYNPRGLSNNPECFDSSKKANVALNFCQVKAPDVNLGVHDYAFDGKHMVEDRVCSTGVIRGTSRRQLCLNLQDESLTSGCAFNERVSEFNRQCRDFDWLESSQCEVSLIRKEAILSLTVAPVASDILKTQTYCIGRGEVIDISSLSLLGGVFHDQVLLNIKAKWERILPISAGMVTTQNSWTMSMVDASGAELVAPFEAKNVQTSVRFGSLLDESAQWRFACKGVARCGN